MSLFPPKQNLSLKNVLLQPNMAKMIELFNLKENVTLAKLSKLCDIVVTKFENSQQWRDSQLAHSPWSKSMICVFQIVCFLYFKLCFLYFELFILFYLWLHTTQW